MFRCDEGETDSDTENERETESDLFLLELLIHRLGDPKCVVSGISGCSDMSVVIRYFMVPVRRTGTFLVYIYMSCTRSRSVPIDDWYSNAVPEVDRLLVQLLLVPKVDRLLVQH